MPSPHPLLLLLALPVVLLAAEPTPVVPTPVSLLVKQALELDPERQAALAALAAERESAAIADAAQDPVISLELGRKRLRDPAGFRIDDGQVWSVSVTRAFEWDDRLRLRRVLAESQVELARLGLLRLEQALSARVQLLAFRLARAEMRAAAAKDIAERRAELHRALLRRDPSGPAPRAELVAAEAAAFLALARADEAALARRLALSELNRLRGAPEDAPLAVEIPRLVFPDAPSVDELASAARHGNFAYRVRVLEAGQASIQSDLSRTDAAPGFTAGPFVSQDRVEGRETIVGLRVDIPLPVGPRSAAADRVAAERRRQATAAAESAWRDVERELVQARLTYVERTGQLRRQGPGAAVRFAAAAAEADRRHREGALALPLYLETRAACLDAIDAALALEEQAAEAGFRLRELSGLPLDPERTDR